MRNRNPSVLLAAGVLVAGVAGFSAAQSSDQAAASASLEFDEITQAAGLWDPLLGMYVHATATADVNNDGWFDLFVGTFKEQGSCVFRGATECAPDRLLLGGPSGFTVDESFPEMTDNNTTGAVFTDLDNDTDLDLVIARGGGGPFLKDTVVLENNAGQFEIATVLSTDMRARHIVPFDYDGDGRLDLFIAEDRYSTEDPLGSSVLFRNDGNFEFVDATVEAGLPLDIFGLSAVGTDLTGDGWPDLLVSGNSRPKTPCCVLESSQSARMFVNEAGTFTEVDASVFQIENINNTGEDDSAAVAVGDLNRDGLPDVVLGHHLTTVGLMELGVPTVRVYLHQGLDATGAPVFAEVTDQTGIPSVAGSSTISRIPYVQIADVDNDRWPDIITGLSHGDGTEPVVFHSQGVDGNDVPQFANPGGIDPDDRDPTPELSRWETWNPDYFRYWSAGTAADFDRDGRVDIMLGEFLPELPSRLLHNETVGVGRWLSVDVTPHVDAVGAVVEIYSPGNVGQPAHLLARQEIRPDAGEASGIPTELHFGLEARKVVDVRVKLSHNRGVIDLEGVATNHFSNPLTQTLQIPASDAQLCNTASTVTAGDLEIDYVEYPIPYPVQLPGQWTIWGEGRIASSGKFYSSAGDHHHVGDGDPEHRNGNSYLYEYDPNTAQICAKGDVLSAFGDWQPGENGYGKIHSRTTEAPDGSLYMHSFTADGLTAPFEGNYQGDRLLRYDPTTEELEDLGAQIPQTHTATSHMSGDLFYGSAFHQREDPTDMWPGTFWVYDTTTDQVIFESQTPRPASWNIAVDRDGRAYYSDDTPTTGPNPGPGLFRYDPTTNTEDHLSATFSNGGWIAASTVPRSDADGTIVMTTRRPNGIYLFNPATETLTKLADLADPLGAPSNIALDPATEDFAYFSPSSNGPPSGSPAGTFLVQKVNLDTGEVTDVVDVGPILNNALGETRGWTTFSLSVSPDGQDIYVAANSGPSPALISQPVLVVIHLPEATP